jgi:hypothetical protein
MRVRSVFLLAALALTVPAVAPAALIIGTPHNDRIRGTAKNDLIDVVGGGQDTVSCGKGIDVVTADKTDSVAGDCEVVSRRISVDTLVTPTDRGGAQHQTEVEPSALGWGSTVVTSFQVGRRPDGGATGIGWATSSDAGRTWRFGILPGVTEWSSPPGAAPRASDPAVAYDAAHGQWLVSTLIIGDNFTTLGINRSQDGVTWDAPVAAANVGLTSLGYDKEWVTCDNTSTSRFYGTCYLVYSELSQFTERLAIQTSNDGGATWSAATGAATAFGSNVVGALPLAQPDGTLTVVFQANSSSIYAVRSVDGGATFTAPIGVTPVNEVRRSDIRVPSLPTATVDASGKMFVAWADCSLRPGCASQDIVFSSSTDGMAWSLPARVPGTGADSFVPGIAADPSAPGHLAVVYYAQPVSCGGSSTCQIGVAYSTSRDGGTTWTKPQRLNSRPISYSWLANTNGGRFVGDYVGATFAGKRFVPTFVLAQPPNGGTFYEYMMSATLP